MEKGMMQKFFIYSMALFLLVKEGCADVTIQPAAGVDEDSEYTFSMDENNHSFKEKTAIFKVIGAEMGPSISFISASATFVTILQPEDDSYVLYSNQSFDYEQNQRLYNLNVMVDSFFETVTINIRNIDDEPPTLTAPQCKLNENTEYTVENSDCSCTLYDPDGWLSQTTFKISPSASGTEDEIFAMGFKEEPDDTLTNADVFIYLKGGEKLDYENISFYLFNIIAKDSAGHGTTPEGVLAIINVGDMRDTSPVWTSMIAFEQFEEQKEMHFTVNARDGDVGLHKPIYYKVNSQDGDHYPQKEKYVEIIDETQGTITVHPIDRDAQDILMYSFEIAAYVSDEKDWSTSQNISFYIEDIDNNPPVVISMTDPNNTNIIFDGKTKKSTNLKFNENYAGDLNISITIKDIDTGENAQFTVELEKNDKLKIDHTQAFMIVPNIGYRSGTFTITVSNASFLDYEDEDWKNIKFNVLAKGFLDKEKHDEMSINIGLIDYNDEKPIFAQEEYDVSINETAKNGYVITTKVRATDRDKEDAILKHSLAGSNYASERLRIDSDTGKICVNKENAFDYDTTNPVFVQVQAVDKANHTTTVPLTIYLLDVNNKAPTISPGDPISVEENQKEGTILESNIKASDMDTTANLTVIIDWKQSYASKNSRRLDMTNETIQEQVEFLELYYESNDGGKNINITLLVNDATNAIPAPDFELFDSLYLYLTVTDWNTDEEFVDTEKNASVIILISIVDINDNTPYFLNVTADNRTVEEKATAETAVGSIRAVDLDVTDTVTYSCEPEDPSFDWLVLDVNDGTFTVRADELIDADTNQTVYFNYKCTASDGKHTSESVMVPFYILDRNNKYPDLSSLQKTIHLLEKPDDDHDVIEIDPTDADRDIPFKTVVCQFEAEDVCDTPFYIKDNVVKVNNGKLIDRDSGPQNYTCSIKCQDNLIRWRSEGVLSTSQSFIILLDDKNDHTPELDMDGIKNITSENKTENDYVSEIRAKDLDEGANADINFTLTSVINDATTEHITSLFDLRVIKEDYYIDATHKRAHLIAVSSLKGHYGKYTMSIILKDRGDHPNTRHVKTPLVIKKYNFEPPNILFPDDKSTFTLLSVQQQNSPLAIFRSTKDLQDFRVSDGADKKTCEKWDMSFVLSQKSPETKTIFNLARKGKCVYQLQINDHFDSEEVLRVEKYELQITAQINTENDDLYDKDAEGSPYSSVRNIIIKFADNAQLPYFVNKSLLLDAEEGKKQNLTLTEKAVYDNDDGDMPIYYSLVTENNTIKNIFEVNNLNGDITIKEKFYYHYDEEFQFQILASNDSNPSIIKTKSLLNVTINVLPANLNPPKFNSEYFFGAILPGYIVDTPIITAEAKDPDFVDQNTLKYWIKDDKIDIVGVGLETIHNPAFEVESNTGRVILKFLVENTMSGYFSFDVCVQDKEDQFKNKAHTVSAKVTIFIITEDKTVDFRFYNNVNEVQDNEKQMLDTMTDVIGIQAYRQSFLNQSSNDGLLTIARLYFINSTINDVVRNAPYQVGSLVIAVDSKEVMSIVSKYGVYSKLQSELRNYKLILVPFPASGTGDSSQLQAWLIGISAVLGALCLVLLGIFIFKIRQLNMRISNLTARKFGSQESGMNRLGISVPTTNKHAIEGSNPIFNAEDMNIKMSKDNADFETHSIRSGDSDLIGVEDNPEFDYAFDQTDDKTTYL